MDESMFEGGGDDRFNDEEDSFDGFEDAMNKPFSLGGSLGFNSGASEGSQNASGLFGSETEDISQGYFAALSQNTLNGPGSDDDEDGDDDDDGNEPDLMYFDADNGNESILLPAKPSLVDESSDYHKTIRFAEDVVFANEYVTMDSMEDSGGVSEGSLELFGGDDSSSRPGSSKELGSDAGSNISDEDDEADAVKEEERKIVRSMMYAGFGAGFFALMGWGFGKIMNRAKSNDVAPEDFVQGADQVAQNGAQAAASQGGDAGIHTASELAVQGADATQNAFNASMTASQGNMSSFAGAPIMPNPTMAGPQLQVMQSMAVNAASNAASSVASASTALTGAATGMTAGSAAGTFAGLSAVVAGTTVATKIAIAIGITSVVAVSSGLGIGLSGLLDETAPPNMVPSMAPTVHLSSLSSSPVDATTVVLPDLVDNDGAGDGNGDAAGAECPGTHQGTSEFQFIITDFTPEMASWVPLHTIFVAAYNSASRMCNEKYQRYISPGGVETLWTSKSGEDIVARFKATVNCNGPCPDNALFGDTFDGRRLLGGDDYLVREDEFIMTYNFMVWRNREPTGASAAPTNTPTPGPTFEPSSSPSRLPSPSPVGVPSQSPSIGPISPGDNGCDNVCGVGGRDLFCNPISKALICSSDIPAGATCGCCDGFEFQSNCAAIFADTGNLEDCCVAAPTASPVASSTQGPIATSTNNPTVANPSPTVGPIADPTAGPIVPPTDSPTNRPTPSDPTESPTVEPTGTNPTPSPSPAPTTLSPTSSPTSLPTSRPTTSPTTDPTASPTSSPTDEPSESPSIKQSARPSASPSTQSPTSQPSSSPTLDPTRNPSIVPTVTPSSSPTTNPTTSPAPSLNPTSEPTTSPSVDPTRGPTTLPSLNPTTSPSVRPTTGPTTSPSLNPTTSPSVRPTTGPTTSPSSKPTTGPTTSPSVNPTSGPTTPPTTGCGTSMKSFTTSGTNAAIEVTSYANADLNLHDSTIGWNQDTNGRLTQINFGGSKLWPKPVDTPAAVNSTFTLTNTNMVSSVKTLPKDTTKTLVLIFENNAASTGYTIDIDCNDGCGKCVYFSN